MYEKILIPLDGSNLSEKVLPYAEELAQKFSSEVTLLGVVHPSVQLFAETYPGSDIGTSPGEIDLSADIARRRLEAEIKGFETYLGNIAKRLQDAGIKAQTHIMEGSPATAILQYAKDANISLIAMCTRGRGGLGRLVFGSVADEVVHNAPGAVLIVRPME